MGDARGCAVHQIVCCSSQRVMISVRVRPCCDVFCKSFEEGELAAATAKRGWRRLDSEWE